MAKTAPRRLQVSTRSLLLLIALFALFLALRQTYILGSESAATAIARAHQLPPLLATLAAIACVIGQTTPQIGRLAFTGSFTSLLAAAALTVEIAEDLRRSSDYWNWRRDWPIFLQIVGGHAILGGLIGFGLGYLRRTFMSRQR
jgi:hypothetical protein